MSVRRLMGLVNGVVSTVLVLVILGVGFMALTAKRSPDGISTFRGYKALSVISGSMEPTIHTGDVIVIRPVESSEDVAKGDILTYHSKEQKQMLITHRVVGILQVNGAKKAFVTKGDANETEDLSTISFEQVVGRYQFRLPYLGYVASFVRKPIGVVLMVIVPGLVLVGMEFRKIWMALVQAEAAEKARVQASGEGEKGE